MPVVEIPGVGAVEFPETMPPDSVNMAAKKLYDQALSGNPGSAQSRTQAPYSGAPDLPLEEDAGAIMMMASPLAGLTLNAARGAGSVMSRIAGQGAEMAGNSMRGAAGAAGRAMASPAAQDLATMVEPRLGAGMRTAQRVFGKLGSAPSRVPEAAGAAPAVAEATQPAGLAAIKPLPENASREARIAHLIETEQAMAREKLPEAAKKRILQAMGHEAPKVAGKIEPPAAGPKATVAEPGSAASRTGNGARPGASAGSAASRIETPTLLAKPRPPGWDTPMSRHPNGYFSESSQAKVAIETMSQNHLNSAVAKRTAELAKFGDNAAKRAPIKWDELQSLKKELLWRAEHGGVSMGRP